MDPDVQELIDYYASLLILQYRQKPNAVAMIKALVTPVIMNRLALSVQDGFSVDTSVGAQLDVIGKYVGITRSGYGTSGQPITLDDDDFRKLIMLVIIKNTAGSSLSIIQQLLSVSFPGLILVSDNQAMQLNYTLVETLGSSDLLQMIVTGGFLPAPMGVATAVTTVPVHTNPFFGFTTYSGDIVAVAPFNSYPLYQTQFPWISYNT